MSTRCMIGYKDKDGIKAVYCHHDGYWSGVGNTLLKWYKDERKVRQLMELGAMSSLGAFPISEEEAFKVFGSKVLPGAEEYSGKYIACEDYGTREGMDHNRAVQYKDEADYLESETGSDREYLYLYRDGEWYATTDSVWSFTKLSEA